MPVRILIADDQQIIRASVARFIRNSGENWEICCEAEDGQTAIEKSAISRPDLVILDLLMPRRDGISAAREIHARLPDVPILIFTMVDDSYVEADARQAGVYAVIQKTNAPGLIAAIRSAMTAKTILGIEPLTSGQRAALQSNGTPRAVPRIGIAEKLNSDRKRPDGSFAGGGLRQDHGEALPPESSTR